MSDLFGTVILAASKGLLVVGFFAVVVALVYMFKAVAHLRPGVSLWFDAPLFNPLHHVLVPTNLTEEGLIYRRRAGLAIGLFILAWLVSVGLDSAASRLTARLSGPASPAAERERYADGPVSVTQWVR